MARQGVFEGWSAANAAAFGWAQAPGVRVVSERRSQRCRAPMGAELRS